MTTILARHYYSGAPVVIEIQRDRIARVAAASLSDGVALEQLPFVAPGLVDLQVNGAGGCEYTSSGLTVDKVRKIALRLDAQGVVAHLATVTTQSAVVIEGALRIVAQARRADGDVRKRVPGIHLEGPYISPEDGPRGAHPRAHVRPPDWAEFERFQATAEGAIRLVTLSPEYDEAPAFIARAVAQGVIVAIGHTGASTAQLAAAVEAGASMSTHLGNGAHGLLPRHPNYIWDQLADDRLVASLIADGHHLPPSVLKSLVRGKSPARCVLVSDQTGLGGMPPGRYQTGLGDVEVLEDGRLVVAGQRQFLAGAAAPLGVGIENLVRYVGLDRGMAVDLASLRPGFLLDGRRRAIETGEPADLILFEFPGSDGAGSLGTFRVLKTILAGEIVYDAANGSPGAR